jgi:transcription antitermination factor NusG
MAKKTKNIKRKAPRPKKKTERKKKLKASSAPKKETKPKKEDEGWVALELSQRGESEKDIAMLKELVIKALGKPNLEIFIPIHYEDEEFFERNIILLNGYFFVRHQSGLPYYKLKDSKFFDGVVSNPRTQEVQIVPEGEIKKLKAQFDQIAHEASQVKVGDTVKILDGLYKNLIGKITKIIKKDNMCIIKVTSLKSRNITISASFLSVTVVEDDESDMVTFF